MHVPQPMVRSVRDEYDFDSSDEEDIRNTVGNVPMQWYESFPHVGYDASGRPIMRPTVGQQSSDAISDFLKTSSTEQGEQDAEWRTIVDPKTGQSVVLSDRDLEIVTRMSAGKGVLGDKEEDICQPWEDFFSNTVLQMPVTAHPPQKRSFIPSLLDRRRVGRITHAIKMGWIRPRLPAWALEDVNDPDQVRRYAMYMSSGKPGAFDDYDEGEILGFSASSVSNCVMPDVWADQDEENTEQNSFAWQAGLPPSLQTYRPPRPRPYMRPAAEPLPGHAESYNPPPEFLLSDEEERQVMRAWRDKVKDNQASKVPPIMPRRFGCLRHVPFSERYLREREERIKDLVMAARVEKQQVHTTPEALLPQIPSLADLRPYPSHLGLEYRSHSGRVTALSISPCGQWLASVSPVDGCLRIWETASNYCFRCYRLAPALSSSGIRPALVAEGLLRQKPPAGKTVEAKVGSDSADVDEERQLSAHVAWNPNPELRLVAAAFGNKIFIINPALGDRVVVEKTDKMLHECWQAHLIDVEESKASYFVVSPPLINLHKVDLDALEEVGEEEEAEETDGAPANKKRRTAGAMHGQVAVWSFKPPVLANVTAINATFDVSNTSIQWGSSDSNCGGIAGKHATRGTFLTRSLLLELSRVSIELHQAGVSSTFISLQSLCECIDLSWHPKGDYLLSLSISPLSSEARSRAANRVLLHRVSRMASQAPFAAATGGLAEEWRSAAFHPAGRPTLFVAATRYVHTFDLVAQKELPRLKLDLSSDHIVTFAVHPTGEHVIAATSDSRFIWFDVELGNVPFKKLRLNHGTVRKVHVHSRRPLVSVALDDGSLFIIHGKVSDDLLSKPVIIPIQLIRTGFHSVFSCVFHSRLPHVYAGGECGTIRQFVPWH
ncbi:Ribosome biogenesis protein bop1 [Echinococcus granulosus]|uniref:Ribosome biogenesis protein bop1 n=1 Tax=Echinococcus granulosus TaxID=6210 RepID=W6V684_ECHGR|nr:Ribosome biogenesis protein bop1 [Echinococcus granulosus]EUB61924.1 Ribosome biogenesis protein bop1 [Echinococcus granulosus]